MFKGLTSAMIIINGLMLGVPALMMFATDGGEWLDRLQLMSPIF